MRSHGAAFEALIELASRISVVKFPSPSPLTGHNGEVQAHFV